eukprot:Pgem_evm1s18880
MEQVSNASRKILLTGATGMIGRRVLSNLLMNNPTVVVGCVLRSGETLNSLCNNLKQVNRWPLDMSRVKILNGDITKDNLGLSPSEYKDWADTSDCVVHTAALINLGKDAKKMEEINVGSTKKVLAFAASGAKPKKDVHFLSSVASTLMFKGRPGEKIKEHYYPRECAYPGYGENKWDSEQLIHKETSRLGLRAMVYRTPFILSENMVQPMTLPLCLVQLAYVTGAAHEWNKYIPMFPLTGISRAVSTMAQSPLPCNKTHNDGDEIPIIGHLFCPEMPSYEEQLHALFDNMDLKGLGEIVSIEEFKVRLAAIKGMHPFIDNISRVANKISIPLGQLKCHTYDTTKTARLLAERGYDLAKESDMSAESFQVKTFVKPAINEVLQNVDADTIVKMRLKATLAGLQFRTGQYSLAQENYINNSNNFRIPVSQTASFEEPIKMRQTAQKII